MSLREKADMTYKSLLAEAESQPVPKMDQDKIAEIIKAFTQENQDMIYAMIYIYCKKQGLECDNSVNPPVIPFGGKVAKGGGLKFIYADLPPTLQHIIFLYIKKFLKH